MPEERGSADASSADWNRSFTQCLELLKGPGDERRWVGKGNPHCFTTQLSTHGKPVSTTRAHVDFTLLNDSCTRFVGLLLVTRLLPQGSDDAVRRVLDALGWTFLQRLLLPLRRQVRTVGRRTGAWANAAMAWAKRGLAVYEVSIVGWGHAFA